MTTSSHPSVLKTAYMHPRYWGTWLLLGMMRLGIMLPFSIQISLGSAFGHLLFLLSNSRKRIARTNLKICFPHLSDKEIYNLSRDSFKNAGISIFETAMAWWASDQRLKKLYKIEGDEYLQAAQKDKKNVLLLSGHFSSTEIGGRLLSLSYEFQAMYKPAKNKLYNTFMWRARSSHFSVIERKNTKQFLRHLKKGTFSWYAPDQNLPREEHVFAPFFNEPILTITATSRISKLTQAIVIPFYPIREGEHYKLIFKTPLSNFPSDDINNDAAAVNKSIEDGVTITPSQYLWMHKRFHILPDGTDRQYQ